MWSVLLWVGVVNEAHLREMARVTTLVSQGCLPEPEEVTVPRKEQTTKVDIESVVDMGSVSYVRSSQSLAYRMRV